MTKDRWSETAQRAAAEARWLRPLALTLFIVGLMMILQQVAVVSHACVDVMIEGHKSFSLRCAVQEVGAKLIQVGPATALVWALYEAQAYLKRIEQGAVWAPSTMKLFGRIGEALIVAAAWSVIIGPTLTLWVVQRGGGLDWQLDAQALTLGGLGIVLTAIAKVLGDVLATAEGLKADSDAIV